MRAAPWDVAGRQALAASLPTNFAWTIAGNVVFAAGQWAILLHLANAFACVVTSVRAFDAQMPLFCAVAASCGMASWWLVPRFGLQGAVAALSIAACVQIAGEALILARAFRRMEPAN